MKKNIQKDLFDNDDVEAMYDFEINRPLNEKIEIALAWIHEYEPIALNKSSNGYYVAFSGGKDSIVLERLFKMSGVKYEAFYNNVTIDPPELVRFIKEFYPHIKWNNPKKHLTRMLVDKSCGPPTRMARWCCEVYKEQGGKGFFRAIGVRAEESKRRKNSWTFLTSSRKSNDPILCPLIYWTDKDIWQFIKMNNMPYCSLYDDGFKRLGCIGCPLGGPKNQRREFDRWPGYEKLWKKGFEDYFKRWKGTLTKKGEPRWIEKFDTVDELWEWWVTGKANNGKEDVCQSFQW